MIAVGIVLGVWSLSHVATKFPADTLPRAENMPCFAASGPLDNRFPLSSHTATHSNESAEPDENCYQAAF